MNIQKCRSEFPKANEWRLIDGVAVKIASVIVCKFSIGDVEDPDIYASGTLIDWQNSEMGKWVMENAVETPIWHRSLDYFAYNYKYCIVARLREQDHTYWTLKWGFIK
jgi:hypothetical protein